MFPDSCVKKGHFEGGEDIRDSCVMYGAVMSAETMSFLRLSQR